MNCGGTEENYYKTWYFEARLNFFKDPCPGVKVETMSACAKTIYQNLDRLSSPQLKWREPFTRHFQLLRFLVLPNSSNTGTLNKLPILSFPSIFIIYISFNLCISVRSYHLKRNYIVSGHGPNIKILSGELSPT